MPGLTVFFRFDDFSESSPVTVEAGLVDAFRRSGVCGTFAVIPAVTEGRYHEPGKRGTLPLGDAKIAFLRQAIADGSVDVALHGWDHRSRSSIAPHSEFRGLSAPEQISRIQQGRDLLRKTVNAEPTVFVPPWNSYDDNTLEALIQQGFKCLSANRYGVARGPLRFVPTTADLRELRDAVTVARRSRDPDPIIGVLLHPYDFKESGDPRAAMTCSAFAEEVRWLTEQPDVRVVPISRLSSENSTLEAPRYRANQPLSFESVFPPFVRTTVATPVFRSSGVARRVNAVRGFATGATYVAAAVLGAVLAGVIWPRLEMQRFSYVLFADLAIGAALLVLLARTAMHREVYFRTMLAVAALSGMMIGALRLWR
jgi:peptidoglycan/xylan/chitin deacetylase (PgdA/CDA1 family)